MEGDKGGLSIESNKHKEGGSSAFEIWNLQNYLTSTFDLGKKSPLKFYICRDKFSFSILKADWQQSGIIHSFPIFQFDPCFLSLSQTYGEVGGLLIDIKYYIF